MFYHLDLILELALDFLYFLLSSRLIKVPSLRSVSTVAAAADAAAADAATALARVAGLGTMLGHKISKKFAFAHFFVVFAIRISCIVQAHSATVTAAAAAAPDAPVVASLET